MASTLRHVTFKNSHIDIAGDLRLPSDFSEVDKSHAALVLVTPGSSVKEQAGGIYAQRMVDKGFVTLVFDPSYQGQSGGEPRDLEDPWARTEDVRCAVDYLMTLKFVDEDRIGVLGICAGGGYAVNAALTEHRIKAVGTVVAVNIGRANRQNEASPDTGFQMLAAVGKQRTIEARGGAQHRVNWIPDSPEAAREAGIDDRDTLEAVDFYRTSRGYNKHSTNRMYFRSIAPMLGFDAFQ
ncbi:hypothetical protein ANO11243_056720 [Dothideomycetidae sp. 11243]|nr:hypothetical protein ANO11243_056720 [fungal sp. No.11243]